MDDNTVYVRGLGDRYTQTQMNGVPVPSPNPEKKTVPLNMFSSSLIESITAAKTFTPDLPGAFAGGSVAWCFCRWQCKHPDKSLS